MGGVVSGLPSEMGGENRGGRRLLRCFPSRPIRHDRIFRPGLYIS